ncbi:hypothetical protein CHUAL_007318, partial [Chamberlinius hualienensis]
MDDGLENDEAHPEILQLSDEYLSVHLIALLYVDLMIRDETNAHGVLHSSYK